MCLCVSYNSKITKYELSNSMTIKAMIIVNRFLEIFQFYVLKGLFILFNYYFFWNSNVKRKIFNLHIRHWKIGLGDENQFL